MSDIPNVHDAKVIATTPSKPGLLVQRVRVDGNDEIRMIDLRNGHGFQCTLLGGVALAALLTEWISNCTSVTWKESTDSMSLAE